MAREAKLRCSKCGTKVTVFEDEIGECGHCPGCGGKMEVVREDFGGGRRDGARPSGKKNLAARVAHLVGHGAEKPQPAGKGKGADVAAAADEPEDEMLADPIEEDAEGEAAAAQALEDAGPQPVPTAAADPALQELEYRLWQGMAEEAGDRAMAARLALWLRAEQAGCSMTLDLPGGVRVPIPQIVLSEAAAAQATGQQEAAWRDGWTRRLLKMAAEWPEEGTIEGVVLVLNLTDGVVAELKASDVWPWSDGT